MLGSRSGRSARRGATLVWVAVAMVMFLGFAALAIDAGILFTMNADLQATADSSALAGVSQLPDSGLARATALEFAAKNMTAAEHGAVLVDGDITLGQWDSAARTFTVAEPYDAMMVTTRRADANGNPVDLAFAPVLGLNQADVVATAIAKLDPLLGNAIIVLDPNVPCALQIRGSIFIDAPGANIQVNSSDPEAVCASGGVGMTSAPRMNVVHDEHVQVGNGSFDSILRRGQPPIPDPLADLPEPTWNPADDLGSVVLSNEDNVTLAPGYYSGGINANGGTVRLTPGIYIFDGEGVRIRGGASFHAEGVMMYLTGTGVLDMRSSGEIVVSPPDPTIHTFIGAKTYETVSVFQARDNSNTSYISGSSFMSMSGRFYFPAAHLDLGGTGDGYVASQFIANTIEVFGNGELNIVYDLPPESGGIPLLVD